MKRIFILLLFFIIVIFLSACEGSGSLCEPGEITYRDRSDPFPDEVSVFTNPQKIEIKGKIKNMDQVISGPLCNNHLSGNIYIGCDIEVYTWEDKPKFLDQCNFTVDPGTIIYVASHNNTAFYKGCDACH